MDGGSNRPCRRNKIRNTVVARILDGTYPPGTRLKELALASEFGVSQAPVREALRELEASGLAVSEPFRGTRVLGADAADLGEAYELKAVIEERNRLCDRRTVRMHDLLPPAALLGNKRRSLKHGHVLLHRGETHVVLACHCGNRLLALDGTFEDVSTRPIGERLEDAVDVGVRQVHIYNHIVVC